ncbi:MAG: response regulator [Gammaproteobacteria bacterium]|nr:response regulator [Gammaproteobacteria bacterium]
MNTRKLLVIDDEPDMSNLVRDVAITAGYEATATYRADVFQETYSPDLDVIVIDLVIPWMNGVELIHFLADSGCRASLILISGFDPCVLDSAKELAQEQGLKVIGVLPKPIRVGDLTALLNNPRTRS